MTASQQVTRLVVQEEVELDTPLELRLARWISVEWSWPDFVSDNALSEICLDVA